MLYVQMAISLVLLLSFYMRSGPLASPNLLLSYSTITITISLHITIILIITHQSISTLIHLQNRHL